MFLDLSTQYTETKTSIRGVLRNKKAYTSTNSSYSFSLKKYQPLPYSYSEPIIKKPAIQTPEKLKKAMFKMSSKSISKIMNKDD